MAVAVYPANTAQPVAWPKPLDPRAAQGSEYYLDLASWLAGPSGTDSRLIGSIDLKSVDGRLEEVVAMSHTSSRVQLHVKAKNPEDAGGYHADVVMGIATNEVPPQSEVWTGQVWVAKR